MSDYIFIKGAREHNLKNINLKLPRNKLIVITGLSGSGKSSLAFDTIYAEGQRRYVESLSAYARQFLGRLEKPNVDYIEGISPAISIDQKGPPKNPRSTVGTITEIYDYLRLLFARVGVPHCPKCNREISSQTIQQMVDQILTLPVNKKIQILAPLVRGRKGHYQHLFQEIRQKGFTKVRVNGTVYDADSSITLERYKKHNIEVVVDRLVIKSNTKKRLAESIEIALKLGNGTVLILTEQQKELLFSEKLACAVCNLSFEELQPRSFSFNSPYGACPECTGLGHKAEPDPDLLIQDKTKSISEGTISVLGKPIRSFKHHPIVSWFWKKFHDAGYEYGINLNKPFNKLKISEKKIILYGDQYFEGAIPWLKRRYLETESDQVRSEIEKYMTDSLCPDCKGKRLKPEALAVTILGLNITQICQKSIKEFKTFFENLKLEKRKALIAHEIIKEIKARLNFLLNVGVDYLTLDRVASTLSKGEAQRIHLATQIGSGLVGVLYVLDEPSIGLHQRDNHKLLNTLVSLKDLGNTLIVIEHDQDTILAADHVVDIGPGAGVNGGFIVAEGSPEKIKKCAQSITGQYLSKKLEIPIPKKRKTSSSKFLEIIGAKENNLKNINVKIPLGVFVCVTGVSGSGKSTLIDEILYKSLAQYFYHSHQKPGKHDKILGCENIDKVIIIDQSPIGRTPRSNPATYTGVFDYIRQLFSLVPEAKMRGYKPGRFSFNLKGGRCQACGGQGILQIEMHFLPDVFVKCEVCKGKRYARETLEVYFKGKNIADILDMTVEQALKFFKYIPKIKQKLQTLYDVGLGYIKLGQSATTLSGGEAQRVKLATELSKKATGRTFYILDEPTTGLHFHDVAKLLDVLNRLVDAGNTVLVIEHNLEVIKCADYIIDLGPEGGDKGGRIIGTGTPEKIVKNKNSYTGQYLKKVL